MTNHFDVIVSGAENAGMGAAGVARAAGLEVAIIESRDVGGNCPLRGCVPKKVLVAAAQVLDQIARASAHHITVDPPSPYSVRFFCRAMHRYPRAGLAEIVS